METIIELDDVGLRYPSGTVALAGASLRLRAGEFVTLLGPSGCGKSTVLRLAAGLERASSGTVRAPADGLSFVFQEPTLMPWASVFDNVWLPLRLAGSSREQARPQVLDMLATVGLSAFADAYPAELSGGMRMRASIARALLARPRVLLMDEPFAALDEITRERLNDDLLGWARDLGLSTLFVTHSVFEAAYLSQRVLVMSGRPGRVCAEVMIDEPWPREAGLRGSARYARLCAQLSGALREAAEAGA
ncbi:ABC transporter ATP-binding protein [Quisquiliibacterium transsilvanicum]|uniref:NitT/TauT family transport system ATP-binding protein n=1 Tax=Quisquiliibacterium transsilvanicum TaxID=1549638 RepID=A0A7W8HKR7_9BURK|nr:ABC transporter ATP-binding protein [Quisquiliibacterium transsilvanicum]MBB5272925.1 NitT/TauT family transport system ATP-binding protein [Quisquiliibacterium transsilvanicum]